MQKTNDLIQNILKKKPSLASEYKNENLENLSTGVLWVFPLYIENMSNQCNVSYAFENLMLDDAEGLLYFEDLMEEGSLQSSLGILEKDYNDAICNKGELDERVFINEEDSLLVSGSQSGGAVNISGSKVCFISDKERDILFRCKSQFWNALSSCF